MNIRTSFTAEFNEDCESITVSDEDNDFIFLQQDESYISIPKADAAAFVDALTTWISTGGKVPA